MACLLYAGGLVAISLSLLTPERLTPIVEHVATKSLQNCNVEIGRVEIGVQKMSPFFNLSVDSLVITSTVTRNLPDEERRQIPEYSDTIL